MSPVSDRLNLGCGHDIRPEYLNVDLAPLEGVDVAINLEHIPYPFRDSVFTEAIAINVLEHLPGFLRVMEELWRITCQGAKINIRVPYWSSSGNYEDPTDKCIIHEKCFEFMGSYKRKMQAAALLHSCQVRNQSHSLLDQVPAPKAKLALCRGRLAQNTTQVG